MNGPFNAPNKRTADKLNRMLKETEGSETEENKETERQQTKREPLWIPETVFKGSFGSGWDGPVT